MTFVKTDVMNPYKRAIVSEETYPTLISFLQEHYPTGFDTTTDISVNTDIIMVDNYDMELKDTDIIVLLERPAVTAAMVGGYAIAAWLANAAISMAISYIIGRIFKPDTPETGQNNKASAVYNLNASQNQAKKGQPIPITYGSVRMYPSMIYPPYYKYDNNEEYLYHLLCLGQGDMGVNSLLIGDQDFTDNPSVEWGEMRQNNFSSPESFMPDNSHLVTNTLANPSNLSLDNEIASSYHVEFSSSHSITFYVTELDTAIGNTINITGSRLNDGSYTVTNVIYSGNTTTVEVTENTILEPDGSENFADQSSLGSKPKIWYETSGAHPMYTNLTVGSWFTTSGITFIVTKQIVPMVGSYLTYTDKDNQITDGTIVPLNVEISATGVTNTSKYELSPDSDFIEIDYVYPQGLYSTDGSNNFINYTDTFEVHTFVDNPDNSTGSPLVITSSGSSNTPKRQTITITKAPYAGRPMWISFKKATPTSTTYKTRNNMVIHRLKEKTDNGVDTSYGDITLIWAKIRATNAISSNSHQSVNVWTTRYDVANSIPEVLTDIYTNTTYGGRLNPTDLDFVPTADNVNGTFEQKMTVYDAMRQVSKSQKYSLYPVGKDLVLVKDEPKTISTGLYNETNIIEDSIKVDYIFKEESPDTYGYSCKYHENEEWEQVTEAYPLYELFPEEIELFGVTGQAKAQEMAKYLYKQDMARRKIITFDTDIQGLVPQFLDKILISHHFLKWATPNEVKGIFSGQVDLYDKVVASTSQFVTYRDIDGSVSDTVPFTINTDYQIDAPGSPSWVKEGTLCAIGIPKEYQVISVKPNGGNIVTIECVNYDESIYS